MKKFGRQAQYYNESQFTSNEKDYNNNTDFDYEDPVDLEFINEFTNKSNTKYKSNHKIEN